MLLLLSQHASASTEVEGEGQARIVGGNFVSARRRALTGAQRDAVAQAVASLLPAERLTELEPRLRSTVYLRAASYIRTYRVVKEEGREGVFRLRIAVVLDLKRLQSEVSELTGPDRAAPPSAADQGGSPPSPRPELVLHLQVQIKAGGLAGAVSARLREMVRDRVQRQLAQAGFSVRGNGAGARGGQALQVRFTMEASEAPGVRGLDWPGGHASAAVTITRAGQAGQRAPEELARASVEGLAAAPTLEQAMEQAMGQAVAGAVAPALPALARAWPVRRTESGQVIVHVSNLASFVQHESILRVLRETVPSVRSCRVLRSAPGHVWYTVRTSRGPSEVARLIEGQVFGTFVLKIRSIEGSSAWMTVEPAPGL